MQDHRGADNNDWPGAITRDVYPWVTRRREGRAEVLTKSSFGHKSSHRPVLINKGIFFGDTGAFCGISTTNGLKYLKLISIGSIRLTLVVGVM